MAAAVGHILPWDMICAALGGVDATDSDSADLHVYAANGYATLAVQRLAEDILLHDPTNDELIMLASHAMHVASPGSFMNRYLLASVIWIAFNFQLPEIVNHHHPDDDDDDDDDIMVAPPPQMRPPSPEAIEIDSDFDDDDSDGPIPREMMLPRRLR